MILQRDVRFEVRWFRAEIVDFAPYPFDEEQALEFALHRIALLLLRSGEVVVVVKAHSMICGSRLQKNG